MYSQITCSINPQHIMTPDASADPSKQGSTTDTSKFDPEEKIDNFDWDQINRNFEEEMQKRKTEELGLFDEMEQLMAVGRHPIVIM